MTDPLGLISGAGNQPIQPIKPIGSQNDAAGGASFKDVLMKNLEQVNRLQQDAQNAIEDLSSGKRDDVANVLMAQKKADMAFQMLVQVRSKMVAAYEEIKQIRV